MAQASFGARQSGDLRGFSLVEVLISMGILTAVSIGLAQLFAISGRANLVARNVTSTTTMAVQKMEQLRALAWSVASDGSGLPISDTSSDLSFTPAPSTGGRGLVPSPPNALDENVPGYCDFLDAGGGWVGTGVAAPSGAVYLRRWAIVPLPAHPHDTLVLQVLVSPLTNERMREASRGPRGRMPGDALLITLKTRKTS
jgi:hypothetical protein